MSFRDSSGRDNGDNQPAFFPAGSVDVHAPAPIRIRDIYVQNGPTGPCTVEVKVNGADIPQNPAKTLAVAASKGQAYNANGFLLNQGDRLQIITSQADAVVSAAFFRA